MGTSVFSSEKMYTYIKGFASGLEMHQTLRALLLQGKSITGR